MKRRIIGCILTTILACPAFAQSGTNSPYSQYGLGILSDQSQGFNRGMNGLAIGLRNGNQVNMLNPASYSAVDSLTMIFDVGVSGQLTNFNEGGKKLNAHNADFEYAVMAMRLVKNVGLSVGVVPYTNIGYNYFTTSQMAGTTNYTTETYSGSGGLHQAYLGLGWRPFKGISVGANISYLWGEYEKTVTVVNSDSHVNTLTRTYGATINSYKLDLGAQYQAALGQKDVLTLGVTFGLGHKLGADPYSRIVNANTDSQTSTSTTDTISNGLELPMTLGVGATIVHNKSLTVGVDYSLQKWGALKYPQINEATSHYELQSGLLKNRSKFTVGGDWVPQAMSRNLLKRIHYRVGASYATPYYKVKGADGPKELSVSAGLGIPIQNSWNNRSFLNISGQWVHASAKDLITENTFRINIGITFNERWFMKWKVQ